MENLLNFQNVQVSRPCIDDREECGVSGDYSLPDYCPDIAVILKCLATPMIQNRHWSGDQLVVDGSVLFRILYLDEDRCRIHSVEFSQPFSCSMKGSETTLAGMLNLNVSVKYVNCRALSPRRFEVRSGINVSAFAEATCTEGCAAANESVELMTRYQRVECSYPLSHSEKILSVSGAFDFPPSLPAAEMLLGGECHADVRECKLLNGKAIVKGIVYIHQLYTDNMASGSTHLLDFTLPYSQILDLEGCLEGLMYDVRVSVLTDTERCVAGPDGDNSVLEVTAKLLVQCQIYRESQLDLLLEAYHTEYPVDIRQCEKQYTSYLGCGMHQSVLPMLLDLPMDSAREIIDVWITPQDQIAKVKDNTAVVLGRLLVSLLVRDGDGQIAYYERTEEYQLEYPCRGDRVEADITVGELRYRVVDRKIELQTALTICLRSYEDWSINAVQELQLCMDTPYPKKKAGAIMYYAQPGERVWDIGRHCHADTAAIYHENDVKSDCILQPTVLVIPLS